MAGKIARDNHAARLPVSIKGVVLYGDRIVLLKNNRNEWELPGGKIEVGEEPTSCLAREIREELGLTVVVGPILDSWLYHIDDNVDVFIVTYGCYAQDGQHITRSDEHADVGTFRPDSVSNLNMPDGYKSSIAKWADTRGSH